MALESPPQSPRSSSVQEPRLAISFTCPRTPPAHLPPQERRKPAGRGRARSSGRLRRGRGPHEGGAERGRR